MKQQQLLTRLTLSSCMFAMSALLAGCTLQNTATSDFIAGSAISGEVHGGQQAISGAKVYLLAVNTTGSAGLNIAPSTANASLSLLNNAVAGATSDSTGFYVTTNSTGNFSISGDFACTTGYAQGSTTKITLSGSEQVYLFVSGGIPVIDGSTANSAIGLLAALGPCNNLAPKISVNEVTTVATAYAFAGYATDAKHISTSGTALAATGINNAFSTFSNLVSISTGLPNTSTVGGNGTIPAANIYTIANVLAACVNSTGPSSSACTTDFKYLTSVPYPVVLQGTVGTAPTETATAAINLAHNVWPTTAGVAALYGTIPATPPYAGGLTSQPNDFSLTIPYSGGSLNNPQAMAIDKSGNIWIVNKGSNSVSEASPTGTYLLSGVSGVNLTSPSSIAIDNAGGVWVGSTTGINKFVPGTTPTITAFVPTRGTNVNGLAVDSFGNIIYVSSPSVPGTLGSINSSGSQISSAAFSQITGAPASVAVDSSRNVWVGQTGTNSYLLKFTGTATTLSFASQATGVTNANSITIDPYSLLFVTEQGQNFDAFQFDPVALTTQTFIDSTAPVTTIQYPNSTAVDSQGNEWIASHGASNTNAYINEFQNFGFDLGPGGGGLGGPLLNTSGPSNFSGPYAIAVDGSGNVWTTNVGNNILVEMIGSAAPVVTPLAASLLSPYTTTASQP